MASRNQKPLAGLLIPTAPSFPLSSPITEEVPSPIPSSPDDHELWRNRPFALLSKTISKNPFIRKATFDNQIQGQGQTGRLSGASGIVQGIVHMEQGAEQSSSRSRGLNLVTDFSKPSTTVQHEVPAPVFVDLNDLKALSQVREQERITDSSSETVKSVVPGSDAPQTFGVAEQKTIGKDELSPSDRHIMIGLRMPFHGSKDSPEGRSRERDRLRSSHTPLTPSIIVTPAKEDTFWDGFEPAHPRPRATSSIYSQPTPYPDYDDHDIPPVPAIPTFHVRADNEKASPDSPAMKPVISSRKQRAFSTGTIFEEDSPKVTERPSSYSTEKVRKIPDRLSINTEATRQSQGWWTYLMSPLFPKTPITAGRPPVPSIATHSSGLTDEWWEKEVSYFSPDTPDAVTHPLDKANSSPSNPSSDEAERNMTSFMFPGEPIQGSAAEYYQACAHELFSGRPYFECVNHICSITPKDKVAAMMAEAPVVATHEEELLIDVDNIPGTEKQHTSGPSDADTGLRSVDRISTVSKSRQNPFRDSDEHSILSGPTLTGYSQSEYPSNEQPLSKDAPSKDTPSEHPPSERSPSIRSLKQQPQTQSAKETAEELSSTPEPQEGSSAAPAAVAESHVGKQAPYPFYQPIIQPIIQPAQPVSQPAPVVVSQPIPQPTNTAPPTVQNFYNHPAVVPSAVLIAPPERSYSQYIVHPASNPAPQPQPPEPVSPAFQRMTERGSIPLSGVQNTPAPAYTSYHHSSSILPPRIDPHPLTREEVESTTESQKIERNRQRLEKEDAVGRKLGGCWRGRGLVSKKGCFGRSGREGRVKRRWYLAICTSFLIVVLLALILALTLTRKGNATPVQSQWLNLTGYPPMPTGIATIAGPNLYKRVPGCIAPSSLWSCALPKEQQSDNKPYTADEPTFRVEIEFRNGTYPNSTTIASRSLVSGRSSGTDPSPSPPSLKDQTFLGNTTDKNSAPYAGEETPFFMSFLSAASTSSSSSTRRRLARKRDDAFPDLNSLIPSPDLNSDETAAAAELYPLSESQPIRLYNRGQATEHYGFYTYFDRSIFLSSLAPLNGSGIDDDANDSNGGSTEEQARVRCTWAQTRFLVQIWTRSTDTLLKAPSASASASATPTSSASSASSTSTSSATDFTRPGSFPYPVTITLDRHGGEAKKKMVYCYAMEADEKVNSTLVKLQVEDRSYGGRLINPAPGIFDFASNSSSSSANETSSVYGGIDGGTGGCSCQWVNWLSTS
ncbi:hypothetical protein BO82DRAFT_150606 [Aspergillus uvarum CBS 121591]|uniref:Uncharacterized protein n=1 Tax=Aspergillus uvarum CBS 121591 TaxID=1448315 RepID=A0A319C1B7_9EURO|nr:hypothetical protein BO82DRAFT_150606 [Aspergillus uvarum CBS 121591]PYH78855.1 hypothetical protein BO82DRAFT_150606 [Aspergillus uvarum CBS 121591]